MYYTQAEQNAKLSMYGEFNIIDNLAQQYGSLSHDDIYQMTVNSVYTLVERGKKLDYVQSSIQIKKRLQTS